MIIRKISALKQKRVRCFKSVFEIKKIKTKNLIFILLIFLKLFFSSITAIAQNVKPESDYLIINNEEASQISKVINTEIKSGIFLFDHKITDYRTDLDHLTNGLVFQIGQPQKKIVLGRPSGEMSNTRNEIWANAEGKYFLLKDQNGRDQSISGGWPKAIIPAQEGMFLIISKNEIIFRNHDKSRNNEIKENEKKLKSGNTSISENSKIIFLIDQIFYTLTQSSRELLYLSSDRKLICLNDKGQYNFISDFEINEKNEPQVVLTNEGIFLSKKEGIEYIKLDQHGAILNQKIIFSKNTRSDEKILFNKYQVEIQQSAAHGGGVNSYYLQPDGQLIHVKNYQNILRKLTQEDINFLNSFGVFLRPSILTGSGSAKNDQKKNIERILNLLSSVKNSWVNIVGIKGERSEDLLKYTINQILDLSVKAGSPWKDYVIYKMSLSSIVKLKGVQNISNKEGSVDLIEKFKNAIKQKKVILVFENYLDDSELGPTNAKASFDIFQQFFRDDIEKGRLKMITTSDTKVWNDFIESNLFFKDNYNTVFIAEPTGQELKNYLKEKIKNIEKAHSVIIDDEVIDIIIKHAELIYPLESESLRSLKISESIAIKYKERGKSYRITKSDASKYFYTYKVDFDVIENINIEGLKKYLTENIIGQDEAIEKIVEMLSAVKIASNYEPGPIAKMFFLGPTGVGKTFSVDLLREYLNLPIIKIDMNHFSGFENNSSLVNKIKAFGSRPYILLFDDFDKNEESESILKKLRNVYCSPGIYAQGTNNEISFCNAIVIMTGNLGDELILESSELPHDAILEKMQNTFLDTNVQNENEKRNESKILASEVWSRIKQSIVVFKGLTEEALLKLAEKYIEQLNQDLSLNRNISIEVDSSLTEYIVSSSFNKKLGISPVREYIFITLKSRIETYLSNKNNKIENSKKIKIYLTSSGSINIKKI